MREDEHVTDKGDDYEVYERKRPRPEIVPGSVPDTSRGGTGLPPSQTHDASDAPADPDDGAWLLPSNPAGTEASAPDVSPAPARYLSEEGGQHDEDLGIDATPSVWNAEPHVHQTGTSSVHDRSDPEPAPRGFLGGLFGQDDPFDPALLPDPPAEPLRVTRASDTPGTPEPAPPARPTGRPPHPTPSSPSTPSDRGDTMRIAIAATEFNYDITHMMVERAKAHAEFLGAEITHVVRVPGVYDLPLAVKRLLKRGDVDGVATIGVVIEGETDHDDLVIQHAARKIVDLSLEHDKPVGLGITGPGMSRLQAEARIDRAKDAIEAIVKLQRTLGAL